MQLILQTVFSLQHSIFVMHMKNADCANTQYNKQVISDELTTVISVKVSRYNWWRISVTLTNKGR